MLKTDSLNIPFKNIQCSCGNELSRDFQTIDKFDFIASDDKRNLGITCNQCNQFISMTTFLSKSEILKVMNNFTNVICNL